MISAPRIRPPARATSEPTPATSFSTKPPVIAGAASSVARRASSSVAWSIPSSSDRLVERRVDRGTDLIRLVDHAPERRDQDDGHQGDQPEHDAGRRRGWA